MNTQSTLVAFQLIEDLRKTSGKVVKASSMIWDPSANNGTGEYAVDRDKVISVGDYDAIGHESRAGARGTAQLRDQDWVIVDLECDKQGSCGESS